MMIVLPLNIGQRNEIIAHGSVNHEENYAVRRKKYAYTGLRNRCINYKLPQPLQCCPEQSSKWELLWNCPSTALVPLLGGFDQYLHLEFLLP